MQVLLQDASRRRRRSILKAQKVEVREKRDRNRQLEATWQAEKKEQAKAETAECRQMPKAPGQQLQPQSRLAAEALARWHPGTTGKDSGQ
jgi:hypothetical protein